MKNFNYNKVLENLLSNPDIVEIAMAIQEYKGKQELFIEAKSDILEKMLEVAIIQSTGASNRIEGIYTSEKRLEEIIVQKSEPKNRSEEEISGYRDVLTTIHENYDYIAIKP
ncbi:MAG: Fic family protein, partial [Cetobacterium sp.]